MARRNRITDTEADERFLEAPEVEETDSLTASETISDAGESRVILEYIGPAYDKGIQLHGTRHLLRPGHMTQDEIYAFLDEHPERSAWFYAAGKL